MFCSFKAFGHAVMSRILAVVEIMERLGASSKTETIWRESFLIGTNSEIRKGSQERSFVEGVQGDNVLPSSVDIANREANSTYKVKTNVTIKVYHEGKLGGHLLGRASA